MKTIGLIGGMSWESTLLYYQQINLEVKRQLGGLHSAKVALYSIDFAEIEAMQAKGEWAMAGEYLAKVGSNLEHAGADFLVLCTNTMHKVAPEIEAATHIPLLHIADATGNKIIDSGIKKIGLLGTAFTMEQAFYKDRLQDKFNISVITPDEVDRKKIHQIIYEELCLGQVRNESKEQYRTIMNKLVEQGAEGIILGCTEITLLVGQHDVNVPIFDTTAIHAQEAVKYALK